MYNLSVHRRVSEKCVCMNELYGQKVHITMRFIVYVPANVQDYPFIHHSIRIFLLYVYHVISPATYLRSSYMYQRKMTVTYKYTFGFTHKKQPKYSVYDIWRASFFTINLGYKPDITGYIIRQSSGHVIVTTSKGEGGIWFESPLPPASSSTSALEASCSDTWTLGDMDLAFG